MCRRRAPAVAGPAPENLGALLVSGGHTEILKINSITSDVQLLGSTIDDAAGEAYDKVARILGLGYPGGPAIDRLARTGNPKAIRFPRGLSQPKYMGTAEEPGKHRYDWSFSGLKTAVARCVEQFEARGEEVPVADIAAAFQEAVVDVITSKAVLACREHGIKDVLLGGGVAANSRLRELTGQRCALRRDQPARAAAGPVHGQRRHGGGPGRAAGDGRDRAQRHPLRPGLRPCRSPRCPCPPEPARRTRRTVAGHFGGAAVVNHDGGRRVRVEVPRFGRAQVRPSGRSASA